MPKKFVIVKITDQLIQALIIGRSDTDPILGFVWFADPINRPILINWPIPINRLINRFDRYIGRTLTNLLLNLGFQKWLWVWNLGQKVLLTSKAVQKGTYKYATRKYAISNSICGLGIGIIFGFYWTLQIQATYITKPKSYAIPWACILFCTK